jgi:CBS domain-containing protein
MKVCDIMTDTLITVNELEPVAAAARLMRQYNLGALPVCDDLGRLRGIVTDRDITMRCVALELAPDITQVQAVMTRGIRSCTPQDEVNAVAQTMAAAQIRRMPVMDRGQLTGMISLCDLARQTEQNGEAVRVLAEISSNVHRLD